MKKQFLMVAMLIGMFTTAQSFAQVAEETKVDGPKGERPKREDMFTKLDSDADGKLSQAEIEKSDKKFLKENFVTIDTNKDNFIDKAELKAYRDNRKAEKQSKAKS